MASTPPAPDFRRLVDRIGSYGIAMLDAAGTVLTWNAGAERIFGCPAGEIVGRPFARFHSDEEARAGKPARELAAAAEAPYEEEGWRVRPDGSRLWANVQIDALRDGQGALLGFAAVVRDATERKQAAEERERLLRAVDAQRRLFQMVVEHAPAGMAIFNGRTLRVKWANPNFRQMLHEPWRGMDITGLRLEDFLPGAASSGLEASFRRVAAGGEPYVDPEFAMPGSATPTWWRWCVLSLATGPGEPPDLMALVTGITEQVAARKRVEELVEQIAGERRFLANILDALPLSVTYVDRDLVYRVCNPRAAVDFGRPAGDVIGRRVREVVPGNPVLWDAVETVLRTGRSYAEPVISLRWTDRPEEGEHHYLVAYIPDKDAAGQVRGIFASRLEITELVNTRRQLEAVTAELGASNRQLELRNREVERANRLKSEFLASMSHELRTPLHAITGFSDLLGQEMFGPLNAKQKRQLDHIQQGARHLLTLINDILDLSKIEAGRVELRRESFLISSAAQEVLSTIRPLASQKQIEVCNLLDPELVMWADRVRCKQILYNLLSNAVKFTPSGGRVEISSAASPDAVEIAVADTGVGIAPEDQEVIFEEFRQAGAATSGVREGAGLGLAITRRLVGMHGGRIRVESRPGQGSRFIFRLPLGDEAAAGLAGETAAAYPPSAGEERLRGAQVLVADDNPAGREFVRDILEDAGCAVTAAADGEDVLRLIEAARPDLVLLDIRMPRLDGFGTLARLRANPALAGLKVAALTAFAMQGDREKALAAGFDAYITKPVDAAALRREVDRLLRA